MSDPREHDEITSLARAYRSEHDGKSAQAGATRAAILLANRRAQQRGAWLAAAIVLVALVSVPTAWALYTGRLSFDAHPEPSAPATPEAPARPRVVDAEVDRAEPATELAPEVTTEIERTEIENTEIENTEAGDAPDTEDLARPALDPAERRAYEEAHALHFEAHDAAGAVDAWDRYLRRYPRGRFAPEARYNRALSLVRLDRRDEAIEALRPFARGTHGGYRRDEATALLEALGAPP